jgi:putative glycosyltransferase (TIGR04372 family)
MSKQIIRKVLIKLLSLPALLDFFWVTYSLFPRSFLRVNKLKIGIVFEYVKQGRLEKSYSCVQSLIEQGQSPQNLLLLSTVYTLCGYFNESRDLIKKTIDEFRLHALSAGLDKLNLRIFASPAFKFFGHIGIIGFFIKAQELGILAKKKNIILGTKTDFDNYHLLQKYDDHCEYISEPSTVVGLKKILWSLEENCGYVYDNSNSFHRIYEFSSMVQLQWEKESRDPLLSLSKEELSRGFDWLGEHGYRHDQWFVGLHVREGSNSMQASRNADIEDYQMAINEIVSRGGWVVRLGDEKMKKLEPQKNVIDYAHSQNKAGWKDLFILAEGKFFIGSHSGPSEVPLLFGKPGVYLNWSALIPRPMSRGDILLPKQYWYTKEKRWLTYKERLSPEFGVAESIRYFEQKGIEIYDNSPEEITDSVKQMMQLFKGYSGSNNEWQTRVDIISRENNLYPVRMADIVSKNYPGFA